VPGTRHREPRKDARGAVANLKEASELYLEEQEEPPAFAPAILTTFSIDTANAEAA
jgi:predicted RNase H-like HicB family nuclease